MGILRADVKISCSIHRPHQYRAPKHRAKAHKNELYWAQLEYKVMVVEHDWLQVDRSVSKSIGPG